MGQKLVENAKIKKEHFFKMRPTLTRNLPLDIQQKRKSRIVDQPFHVLGFLVKNYLTIDAQNEIGRLEAGSFRRTAWFYGLDL